MENASVVSDVSYICPTIHSIAEFIYFSKGSEAEEHGKDRECVGRSDERGEISHDRGSKFPHGNNNLTALRPIGERVTPTETRSSKDTMRTTHTRHGRPRHPPRLQRRRPKCLLGMDLVDKAL